MEGKGRNLIITDDGSHSIVLDGTAVSYHSLKGAIQESQHVFIGAGLKEALRIFPDQQLNILEMGFGTGLNAFLTAIATLRSEAPIRYWGLEAYPLDMSLAVALNYPEQLGHEDLFNNIQLAPWNAQAPIHENFILRKETTDLLNYTTVDRFHLVYFDAFAPEVQPELWTEDVFQQLANLMQPGAILTTYCSKGSVRRAMEVAGLQVEKLSGPPGKREMVRARKA